MHELSIAESLIELVLGQLALRNITDPVAAVHVRIGALAAIVPPALETAFRQARGGTPLAAARLEIARVPTVVWCPACAAEQTPADPRRLLCPACGARTPDIRRGLELELASIELTETAQEKTHAPDAGSTDEDPEAERRGGTRASQPLP